MSTQPPLPESNKDIVTGAYNAQYFRELLSLEIARAERYRLPLSLLIGEIDNFKELEANLGGLGRDKVFKAVTDLIQMHSRLTDFVCMTGPHHELAIILTHTDLRHAGVACKRLQHCLEHRLPEDLRGKSISMTFGIGEYQSSESPGTFFKRVEQALQRAKNGDDSDEGLPGAPVRA